VQTSLEGPGARCEPFVPEAAPGPRWTLAVAPDLAPGARTAVAALLLPDALEALPAIAAGPRSRVARLEVGGARLVVKRYSEPGLFLLRTFLVASRAAREARALQALAAALPWNAIRPMAWAEERRAGFAPRSWLVTTELTDSVNLRRIESLEPAVRAIVRGVVLDVLPGRVAELHAAGLFARNLHAKNVLVQPASGAVGFIDLPHARRVERLSRGQRVHDLACLVKGVRRGLPPDDVRALVSGYARAAGLPDDLHDDVAAQADRLDNLTPLAGWVHLLRKRLRRTWLGERVVGQRYGRP
jgi:hypothetical protein